jgi:hypothetical protein
VVGRARFFAIVSFWKEREQVSMHFYEILLFFWTGKKGAHYWRHLAPSVFLHGTLNCTYAKEHLVYLLAHQDFRSVSSESADMALFFVFFPFIIKALIRKRPIRRVPHGLA